MIDNVLKKMDDGRARAEWGWNPTYDLDRIIKEFVAEVRQHPDRYA